ncbi:hypothetical protein FBY06_118140 [Pseudomonas sp. SJZ085]|nr:hypothetical protein FBY00_1684 [Pseudomonas sp. SJZ075]TWC17016.1 hypothetical protein FBX99_1184 [Pseudomonas sp. SJZ074]TWC25356.1 hypothetical protein FBY02_16511 [Pseudomonas sp. SJZ078]TWC35230.1 hypothetical protein FBY06_118140 [Pseudomonas sp. SJZ085]TWC44102.1 hypothetical protein FBY11_1694 [Pseudomonas sp. SJZ124]TWC79394.1 hypothetical protein FBY09_1684 [Pseudomonas sp. SJZ101]
MHETIEASGITPQPCLLAANQAQMGHLPHHFCFARPIEQAAAGPYCEVQPSCVDTLLKLVYQRIVQRPGSNGDFPPWLFLSGNTQIAFQGLARTPPLRRISEHALRVIFFPSSQQSADKVFAITEMVIERSTGHIQSTR